VQRACVALLKSVRATVIVTSQYRASRVTKGLPDVYFLHPKVGGAWIEVKRPKGKQSPEQEAFEHACLVCGVLYWLIDSEDALVTQLRLAGVIR